MTPSPPTSSSEVLLRRIVARIVDLVPVALLFFVAYLPALDVLGTADRCEGPFPTEGCNIVEVVEVATGTDDAGNPVIEPVYIMQDGREVTADQQTVTVFGTTYIADPPGPLAYLVPLAYVLVVFVGVQGLWGWTPGKALVGIRLVGAGGRPPGVGAAAARWAVPDGALALVGIVAGVAATPQFLAPLAVLGAVPLIRFGATLLERGGPLSDQASGLSVVPAGPGEVPAAERAPEPEPEAEAPEAEAAPAPADDTTAAPTVEGPAPPAETEPALSEESPTLPTRTAAGTWAAPAAPPSAVASPTVEPPPGPESAPAEPELAEPEPAEPEPAEPEPAEPELAETAPAETAPVAGDRDVASEAVPEPDQGTDDTAITRRAMTPLAEPSWRPSPTFPPPPDVDQPVPTEHGTAAAEVAAAGSAEPVAAAADAGERAAAGEPVSAANGRVPEETSEPEPEPAAPGARADEGAVTERDREPITVPASATTAPAAAAEGATPSAAGAASTASADPTQPQWDRARRAYICWDGRQWLQYDDDAGAWGPISQ